MNSTRPEVLFQGNGVSPGVALGSALKLDSYNRVILKTFIGEDLVEQEIERVQHAIQISREQLEGLKLRLEKKVGPEHGFILDVHILMLEDKSLMADIISIIRNHGVNAEWAVRQATDRIRKTEPMPPTSPDSTKRCPRKTTSRRASTPERPHPWTSRRSERSSPC